MTDRVEGAFVLLPTNDWGITLSLSAIYKLTSHYRFCSIIIRSCKSWTMMYFVSPIHRCYTFIPPPLLSRLLLLHAFSASGALRSLLVAGHSTRCLENTRLVGRSRVLDVRRAAGNPATRTWPRSRNRPPPFRSGLRTDSRGRRSDDHPPRSPSSG